VRVGWCALFSLYGGALRLMLCKAVGDGNPSRSRAAYRGHSSIDSHSYRFD
jgi:hypothetical protein